jgi:ankyrin repeat protein
VNGKTQEGRTPLHIACANGSLAATRLLCEAGADLSPAANGSANGATPLNWAVRFRYDAIAAYLRARGATGAPQFV